MRLAWMGKRVFERAGNLKDCRFRPGAVRFDRGLLAFFATTFVELIQARRVQTPCPVSLIRAPFAAARPILRQLARGVFRFPAAGRPALARESLNAEQVISSFAEARQH